MKALGLVVSDKKIFFMFSLIYLSLCKTCDPQGMAIFWPKGHNLIKLGRGPLGDATFINIKALGLLVLDKNIFSCFPV